MINLTLLSVFLFHSWDIISKATLIQCHWDMLTAGLTLQSAWFSSPGGHLSTERWCQILRGKPSGAIGMGSGGRNSHWPCLWGLTFLPALSLMWPRVEVLNGSPNNFPNHDESSVTLDSSWICFHGLILEQKNILYSLLGKKKNNKWFFLKSKYCLACESSNGTQPRMPSWVSQEFLMLLPGLG